jgi:xanthine/uracil permease
MNTHVFSPALILILILSWALPVYSIIYNRFFPGFESALGVAYGLAVGGVIHLLAGSVWLLIRRANISRAELIGLSVSLAIMVIMFLIADGGNLSKMGP